MVHNMRNAQDVLITNLMACFDGLGLSAEQDEKVEEYLKSTGFARDDFNLGIGDATLDLYDSRYSTQRDALRKNFMKLDKHIDDGLYSRFVDVNFQIFGITIRAGLSFIKMMKSGVKPAQGIAVTAVSISSGNWVNPTSYKNMAAILTECKRNINIIHQAMEYIKNSPVNAKLMLLSALFYSGPDSEKTGRICFMTENKPVQQGGLLGGFVKGLVSMMTGENQVTEPGGVKRVYSTSVKENVPEFNQMCGLFRDSVDTLFTPALDDRDCELIKNYISIPANFEKPVPEEIFAIFGKQNKYQLFENNMYFFVPLAGLNYRKSPVLANYLRVLMALNPVTVCEKLGRAEYKTDMREEAIRWYYDLNPNNALFIDWLARKKYAKTLKFMAECEPEAYLQAVRSADVNIYPTLMEQTESVSRAVYDKYYATLKSAGQNDKKQKIINEVVAKGTAKDGTDLEKLSNEVIYGEKPFSALYPYTEDIAKRSWSSYWVSIKAYAAVYGEDDFVKNVMAYIALRSHYATVMAYCTDGRGYSNPDYEKIFKLMDEKGINAAIQFNVAIGMYEAIYGNNQKTMEKLIYKNFARKLITEPDALLDAIAASTATGRVLAVKLVDESNTPRKKEALLSYVKDSSKQVKAVLVPVLEKHGEWADEYVKLLSSKKAGERELAANLLAKCKGDYSDALKGALAKEKNEAALKAMAQALGNEASSVASGNPELAAVISKANGVITADSLAPDNIVKELHKGGKKRGLAWIFAFEGAMPVVHAAPITNASENEENKEVQTEASGDVQDVSGNDAEVSAAEASGSQAERTEATEEYLQAILLAYSSLPVPGVSDQAKILAAGLDKNELALYMQEVYERFMKDGAEAKKKWVLYAAAIHGGSGIVPVLKHQIDEWAAASRGAIAAEAIKALALNDSPTALLIVDNIARKYKFKQVRNAAKEALNFAASQLGLTVEELSDRIVPDLDFNASGERVFDYGERSFTVRITPALDIIIKNNEGKLVKSMPAPGKSDDEAKANAAYAEFKEMKTQMKTVVKNQSARLEMALSSSRLWTKENWEKLFVKNPIMHQFAISLIWGVYDENLKPTQTFRYMEDGSFNTVDEDEYTIPEDAKIGLIHPVEISEEEKKAWQEQLEDYEIKQAINQLARPVFLIEEDEKKARKLSRFNGASITDVTLTSRLVNMGWEKGPALDAGIFVHFYREDKDAGLGVELSFSGAYIGGGYDYSEDVDVEDARFYRPDKTKTSYGYDSIKDDQALVLSDIPARYFSEIVYQLTKATAVNKQEE